MVTDSLVNIQYFCVTIWNLDQNKDLVCYLDIIS